MTKGWVSKIDVKFKCRCGCEECSIIDQTNSRRGSYPHIFLVCNDCNRVHKVIFTVKNATNITLRPRSRWDSCLDEVKFLDPGFSFEYTVRKGYREPYTLKITAPVCKSVNRKHYSEILREIINIKNLERKANV